MIESRYVPGIEILDVTTGSGFDAADTVTVRSTVKGFIIRGRQSIELTEGDREKIVIDGQLYTSDATDVREKDRVRYAGATWDVVGLKLPELAGKHQLVYLREIK